MSGLEEGGVCAGVSVWDVRPGPYSPKSSALEELALLHFLPLFSPNEDSSLFSCPEIADDKNLLSCPANDDRNLFSCCPARDMNLFSCDWCDKWELWCKWCSSMSPDTPKRPPTKFGLSSSIILEFCPQPLLLKLSWRLKMAGKMLNCWGSPRGGSWSGPPPPAPPRHGTPLKSNVEPDAPRAPPDR